jgi:hypothetical protein
MRLFWYIIDALQAVTFSIGEAIAKSKLWLPVFIFLIALLIPVMIYLAEKQRKRQPVDYSW